MSAHPYLSSKVRQIVHDGPSLTRLQYLLSLVPRLSPSIFSFIDVTVNIIACIKENTEEESLGTRLIKVCYNSIVLI